MTKLHTGLKDCIFCKGNKITCLEVLMGRMKLNPLSNEQQINLEDLLIATNLFRNKYGKPLTVSSGYRPPTENTAAGGAKNSTHLSCQAIDFNDRDKLIKEWITKNPQVLVECNLYQESPAHTPTWVHVQTRKTKSGNRVFIP